MIGFLRACAWMFALACLASVFPMRALAAGRAPSPIDARATVPLNTGWRFKEDEGLKSVEGVAFDDSKWPWVDVPHTWNRVGNEGAERSPLSNLVRGTGWYRLRFRTPPASRESRYFLQFDAVSEIADVWLNGRYLGRHAGAFGRFRFDATAAIRSSDENILVVKADNSKPAPGSTTADVIPLSGDFFIFGGIYREVSLIVTSPVHVDLLDFGGPGLYARALEIQPDAAVVQVSGRVTNDASTSQNVLVETSIEDADGKVVASTSSRQAVPPRNVSVLTTTLRVEHPRLWQGTRDPYLYRTVMTLRSEQGVLLDRVRQPLGLRTIRFDPNRGLFLNGDHLLLKGVSMHQDRPVKGWAISRADQEEDFELLADLGANAVRLAHYQHDSYSYEAADARGIIVWAEIPLVNHVSLDGSPATTALADNARQQLTELIRQNYNHPSIAVWSIANEIDLVATQTPGTMNKGPGRAAALLQSLNQLAKTEDPGRSTTFADCCEPGLPPNRESSASNATPRDQIVGIADTVGYNRYFGWYTGRFEDFGVMLDAAHASHPDLPLAVSEYGAGAALTQHSDNPTGGPINPHGRPHPEEYQNLYHEASWSTLRERPYLWGVFIWNLFDFASASRHEGDLSDINEKGLISYDRRTRKDAFYFYRANWNTQPTLHLVGRRYTDRPYAVINVKAYSNAAQARLSVNDVDQGIAPCAGGICVWHSIQLAQGTNALRASAEGGGNMLTDTVQWTFSGSPGTVRIKAGDLSGYVSRGRERYGSDTYFRGGEGRGVNPPDTRPEQRVEVAAEDPPLYDSFREGDFSYNVPVPEGRYRITAMFEEPVASGAGERVFNVEVNGAVALKDFDIFKSAGGTLKAVERSFEAESRDGRLHIAFKPVKGKALLTALSINPIVPSARAHR